MRAGFCLFRQILASQKEVREPWKTRSEEKGVTGMPEVRVNHVILHYEEMGQGADTLVFSHSYLVDSSHFYPQMKALSDRYRCLAYDHRGHGRSEVTAGGYDMENLFADAVGFIEKMNCAPCHFIGLSTGGFIGLRIGIRRPDLLKTLILMDTSAEAEPKENLGRYKILLFVVRWSAIGLSSGASSLFSSAGSSSMTRPGSKRWQIGGIASCPTTARPW